MVLVVDVGNTNTVVGVYKDDDLICKFRLQSIPDKTTDEYASLLISLLNRNNVELKELKGSIISSVVPSLQYTFERVITKYLKLNVIKVNSEIEIGMKLEVDNPFEVGTDRITNAVAGIEKYGAPCIIIDFGTATTFDIVNSAGNYIGGIISPGIMLASKMLRLNTAQLPEVGIVKPKSVVGTNTITNIQSGIYYGYLEMINGLLKRVINEKFINDEKQPKIIVTGGLGSNMSNDMELESSYEPNLTLDGLKILYHKNTK